MKNRFLYYLFLFFIIGCQTEAPKETPSIRDQLDARAIIQEAIQNAGGEVIDNATISFNFRDKSYNLERKNGQYIYQRKFTDTADQKIVDLLTNDSLIRMVDQEIQILPSKDSAAYARSINSVAYFALLPYFLQDPAVKSTYLGMSKIKDRFYHKVAVGFHENGGGVDFEDEFVYWFEKNTLRMDYVAYNYKVDGGGARFRVAYNQRMIKDIRFADYLNLKPRNGEMAVEKFDSLFDINALDTVSKIELKRIRVTQ